MSTNAENKKVFPHFTVIPPELRMMVLNEMGSQERCRYSMLSKLNLHEVKRSQNHIYSLELHCEWEATVEINVVYSEYTSFKDKVDGYRLMFEEQKNKKKCITYRALDDDTILWQVDLDDSTDLMRIGLDNFKELLKFHQNNIQELSIEGKISNQEFWNFEFDSQRFSKLETLGIYCSEVRALQFLPKIRKPLKKLVASDDTIATWEQIYEVSDLIRLDNLKLNYQQLLQLSARSVSINIGYLTEQDILNFVKSWEHGKYDGTMEVCEWNIKNANFDTTKLWQLFGKFQLPQVGDSIEITHKKSQVKGRIRLSHSAFIFFMRPVEEEEDDEEEEEEEDEVIIIEEENRAEAREEEEEVMIIGEVNRAQAREEENEVMIIREVYRVQDVVIERIYL